MKTRILLALLAVGGASVAVAQTPESKQSASPTSNQYRIRIAEPMQGATITGRTVNIVVVDPAAVPAGTSVSPEERKDSLRPTFQIWVDGKDYGNLPADQNVFTATDLAPGPHTIVVAAKNNAGELIDRTELKFTTVEASAAAPASPATGTTAEIAPPPPPPPAPAPVEPVPAEPMASEEPSPVTAESDTLPATATAHPAAALGGLALMGLGLALRRRR
ncbi:MAG: LPXTG cell wall anchor domain-containing protein [Thermoanaerobaculia bacterium]